MFPNPEGRPYSRVPVSRVFRKAARAVGLRDFRFHALCHHGATMALNAGLTGPIVMMLGGWGSRLVALERSLTARSHAFAHCVIAHEFAHALLRNRGRHPREDPEVAADSLAAAWGFRRPATNRSV